MQPSFWLTITAAQLLGVTMFEHPSGKKQLFWRESSVTGCTVQTAWKKRKHHSWCTTSSMIKLRLTHFCGIYSVMVWCATRPKTASSCSVTHAGVEAIIKLFFYASGETRRRINNGGFRRKLLFSAKKMGLQAEAGNDKRFAHLTFWPTLLQRSHRSFFCFFSNPSKLKRAVSCPACETPLKRQWYRSFLAPCSHVLAARLEHSVGQV